MSTRRGKLRALEIASAPGVANLAFGNVDLGLALGLDPADDQGTLYARSHLVLASRAGIEPVSGGVWVRYRDLDGLREEARRARRLGFFGKSAVHPLQVPVINEVFSPRRRSWSGPRRVVAAFEASGGEATRLEDGEMIDGPVEYRLATRCTTDRGRNLIDRADGMVHRTCHTRDVARPSTGDSMVNARLSGARRVGPPASQALAAGGAGGGSPAWKEDRRR